MHKNAKKQIYCKLYMRCYPSHMEVETAKGLWRLAELRECEKYQNTMKERVKFEYVIRRNHRDGSVPQCERAT